MYNAANQVTSHWYDAAGNRTRISLNQNYAHAVTTETQYNRLNQVRRVIEGAGELPNSPLRRVTEFEYDHLGNRRAVIVGVTAGPGQLPIRTNTDHDALGRAIAVTEAVGRAEQRTSTFRYDAADHVLEQVTGIADEAYAWRVTTTYKYDDLNRQIRLDEAVGSDVARTTSFQYDIRDNLVSVKRGISSTPGSPVPVVTSYGYDALGRQVLVIEAFERLESRVTTRHFDAADNLAMQVVGRAGIPNTDYDRTSTTTYAYDRLGQRRFMTELGYLASARRTTEFQYDAFGNLTALTRNVDALAGTPALTARFGYDALRRQIQSTEAANRDDNRTISTFYDAADNIIKQVTGESTSLTYAHTAITTFAYNALNQKTGTTEAVGRDEKRKTTYEYDHFGNVTAITAGQSIHLDRRHISVTRYGYDALRRRILQVLGDNDPLLRTWTTFRYDAADQLREQHAGQADVTSYAHQSRTTFEYDRLGRQRRVTEGVDDPHGLTRHTHFEYNSLDQMIWQTRGIVLNVHGAVTNPGVTTSFGYDALNRVTKITEAATRSEQRIETRRYDAADNLRERITGQSANQGYEHSLVTRYGYDALNRLDVTEEAPGSSHPRLTLLAYDHLDNLTRKTAGLSPTAVNYNTEWTGGTTLRFAVEVNTEYQYNSHGQVKTLIEVAGPGHPEQRTSTFIYDAAGNLVEQTVGQSPVEGYRAETRTRFVYDRLNRQVGVLEAATREEQRGTERWFDAANNLTRETTGLSANLNYANVAVTNYKYDVHNRRTEVRDAGDVLTTFGYDAAGNLTGVYEPHHRVTISEYDVHNRVKKTTTSAGSSSREYDTLDHLTRETERGNETRFTEYQNDGLGRRIQVKDRLGKLTTYSYDSADHLTRQANPLNIATRYVYDALGRLRQTISPAGKPDEADSITTSLYDALDRLAGTIRPGSKPEQANHTQYDYDGLGRRLAVHHPGSNGHANGAVQQTLYDAQDRILAEVDALGHRTSFQYDALGMQTGTQNALGHWTRQRFDAQGNRTWLRDPGGSETTSKYRPDGQVLFVTDARGQTTHYEYHTDGNVKQITDRNGRVRKFEYDAAGLLEYERWYLNATTTVAVQTFEYKYDAEGRVKTARNAAGTVERHYDGQGRLESEQQVTNLRLTYTYDDAGRRTFVRDNHGRRLQTEYNAKDEATTLTLEQVSQGGTAEVFERSLARVTMTFDGAGQLQHMWRQKANGPSNYANASEGDWNYDPDGRVTSIRHHRVEGDSTSAQVTYTYDLAGRLAIEQMGGTPKTVTFVYDAANQLLEENVLKSNGDLDRHIIWVRYNEAGNRVEEGSQMVSGGGNQLAHLYSGWDYKYDHEGNRTEARFTPTPGQEEEAWFVEYEYDWLNRLTRMTTYKGSDKHAPMRCEDRYEYDALGRRVTWTRTWGPARMTIGGYVEGPHGSVERYGYDGDENWADWSTGVSGGSLPATPTAWYLSVDQLEAPVAKVTNGVQAWYLTDGEGSVIGRADSDGVVSNASLRRYDGYGAQIGGRALQETAALFDRFGYRGWEDHKDVFRTYTQTQYEATTWFDRAIYWTERPTVLGDDEWVGVAMTYAGNGRYYNARTGRWLTQGVQPDAHGYRLDHSSPLNAGHTIGGRSYKDQEWSEYRDELVEHDNARKRTNRWMGGAKLVGAAFEIYGGVSMLAAGIAALPAGGSGVPLIVMGAVGILHGADSAFTGGYQIYSGENERTYTEQALTWAAQRGGMSEESAKVVGAVGDGAIGLVGSMGVGWLAKGGVRAWLTTSMSWGSRVASGTRAVVSAAGRTQLAKGVVNGLYQGYAAGIRGRPDKNRVDQKGATWANLAQAGVSGFLSGAADPTWGTTASAVGGAVGSGVGRIWGGEDGQRLGLEIGDAIGGLGFSVGFAWHNAAQRGRQAQALADCGQYWRAGLRNGGYDLAAGGLGAAAAYASGGNIDAVLAGWQAGRAFGNLAQQMSPQLQKALMQACFCGEMLLEVPGGTKRIDAIGAGERVLARDEYDVNGEVEAKTVEAVFRRWGRVGELHLTDGQVIRTTLEHPFFEQSKGWVACGVLEEGDWLSVRDGRWVRVERVVDTGREEWVYNLRVADYHTYFVSAQAWGASIWAHNQYDLIKARLKRDGVDEGTINTLIDNGELFLPTSNPRQAILHQLTDEGHVSSLLRMGFDPAQLIQDFSDVAHPFPIQTDRLANYVRDLAQLRPLPGTTASGAHTIQYSPAITIQGAAPFRGVTAGHLDPASSSAFQSRVEGYFTTMLTTPTGRGLYWEAVRAYYERGHTITIAGPVPGHGSIASYHPAGDGRYAIDSKSSSPVGVRRGDGQSSYIHFAEETQLGVGFHDWQKVSPDVILAHELVHSVWAAHGLMADGSVGSTSFREEQAVGLGLFSGRLSENSYRRDRGLPERPEY